ncbi:cell wall-associated NlpC family hydrolase [Catalinimonas alkaloidigena]|uniref:C40 family peptidase n=1 Tax=Catalinimonas alkaloidigena TaxID=1075417 RepID=UPI002406140F|nr:SH3 domain-containing C40 family peptidase [Catalinimonas alkaloidigena]MDF9800626.1 cell wall-associated NlpC family hydrolase [Catalinimonas alkaloidigena]
MIKKIIASALYALALLNACAPQEEQRDQQLAALNATIEDIKSNYAPDKRVALFDIQAKLNGDTLTLKGETDQPAAKQALLSQLAEQDIHLIDSINTLPEASLGEDTLGVVYVSVANIRSQPRHSGELATQATMGMPLKILKKEGEWHLVQTPDKYISWVQGSFVPMNQTEYADWQAKEKVIFTEMYGFAYEHPIRNASTISDLVAGNVMELVDETPFSYEIRLPDGRNAYVRKNESDLFEDWVAKAEATENTVVETAFKLMGVPYLWGGTSSKGVDCSGFTKTIYFMNGKILPRDASQQVYAGELIDEEKNFDQLRPGDLLFFGYAATDSTRERITHVGMWIGDNQFIHSPGLEARVKISSVDPESEYYDEYNLNRYIRTKRMINSQQDIIALRDVELF